MPFKLNYEESQGIYSKRFMGKDNGQVGRKYSRYRATPSEKLYLRKKGFISVNSSNVSAIAKQNDDLYVRFHDGSLYRYNGHADLFDNMLKSPSKGRYVWNKLRKPKLSYQLVGTLPIPNEKTIEINDVDELNNYKEQLPTLNNNLNELKLTGNTDIVYKNRLKDYQNKSSKDKRKIRKTVLNTNKYEVNKQKTKDKRILTLNDVVTTVGVSTISRNGYGWVFNI